MSEITPDQQARTDVLVEKLKDKPEIEINAYNTAYCKAFPSDDDHSYEKRLSWAEQYWGIKPPEHPVFDDSFSTEEIEAATKYAGM